MKSKLAKAAKRNDYNLGTTPPPQIREYEPVAKTGKATVVVDHNDKIIAVRIGTQHLQFDIDLVNKHQAKEVKSLPKPDKIHSIKLISD